MTYIDKLAKMNACPEAIEMLRKAKHPTLQKAWDAWKSSDHMLWLLYQVWGEEPACPKCERNARLFACDCAERALKREREAGRKPDKRSWEAIRIARLFACGKSTAEDLAAARASAWAAAGAAARAAARASAWAAVWAAAGASAWAAVWAAAGAAVWAAAWAASGADARAAARSWQARRLRHYFPSAPRLV